MSLIKECRCEEKSLLRVDFALKSISLANENSHDKSPSLANVDSLSKSPSLAEGDLGGGLLENDKNSQNHLKSKENSQFLENSRIENLNAEFTHPQTPSAREGALNGANYTLQGKGASRAVPQARKGEILDCSLARNGEFMESPFAKDISQNLNTKDKKCVI